MPGRGGIAMWAGLLLAGCAGGTGGEGTSAAPHPLPRRDKPKKPIDLSKPPWGDNSRCYVCHLNFEDEPLVQVHAYAAVTCEKCHGSSDDHCGAENHDIAPDLIYSKAKIAPMCWRCHPQVRPPEGWRPARPEEASKGCLECHFSHRLERRDREWDKETRALIR